MQSNASSKFEISFWMSTLHIVWCTLKCGHVLDKALIMLLWSVKIHSKWACHHAIVTILNLYDGQLHQIAFFIYGAWAWISTIFKLFLPSNSITRLRNN